MSFKLRVAIDWNFLAGVVSLLGTIVAVVAWALIPESAVKSFDLLIADIKQSQAVILKSQDQFDRALSGVEEQVGAFKHIIEQVEKLPKDADLRLLIANYRNQLDSAQDRMKKIEDIIVQDPQRSLSLVLMKRDIEAVQKNIDEKLTAVNSNVERLFNMFGWSLGGLIVAILGQVIAGFFASRRSKSSPG